MRSLPGRAPGSCERAGSARYAPVWGACAAYQGALAVMPWSFSYNVMRITGNVWQHPRAHVTRQNVPGRHLCNCRKVMRRLTCGIKVILRDRCACTAEGEEAGCKAETASCATLWTAACSSSARRPRERLLLQMRSAKQLWHSSERWPINTILGPTARRRSASGCTRQLWALRRFS